MKILIVCSSNTCRSPYAEFIFKRLVSESDVLKRISKASRRRRFSISRARCTRKLTRSFWKKALQRRNSTRSSPTSFLKTGKSLTKPTSLSAWVIFNGFCFLLSTRKIRQSFKSRHRKNINIPDPFYRKSMEFYKNTMDVIKTYLIVYAEKLEKEFSKKD